METHKLKRNEGGEGMMGWIQPKCSCGWEGRKEYAYGDYQYTNVQAQEKWHLKEATGNIVPNAEVKADAL